MRFLSIPWEGSFSHIFAFDTPSFDLGVGVRRARRPEKTSSNHTSGVTVYCFHFSQRRTMDGGGVDIFFQQEKRYKAARKEIIRTRLAGVELDFFFILVFFTSF